jgi:hypothetical protein
MTEECTSEFRLRVGEVVIGLGCPSPAYAASLADYFGAETALEPNIRLRLTIVPHDDMPTIPDSLFRTKRLLPAGTMTGPVAAIGSAAREFDIADGLVTGCYDPCTREGELRVKCVLTNNQMTRVFEQLLYQAFYSAAEVAASDSFLIHASGVVRNGAGYLFVGAPGAGKSTVASLSGECGLAVLNDEICLVRFLPAGAAGGPLLAGTPFNGLFRDKAPGEAPLRAVLLLAQAPRHRLVPVGRAMATAIVAGQIVPPAGLDRTIDGHARSRLLECADRLCAAAPTRGLEFLPDAGFWQEIAREFEPGHEPAPDRGGPAPSSRRSE